MVKRHTRRARATPAASSRRRPTIHVSNVAHLDPKSGKPTRIGYKSLDDGRKVRFARRSGEMHRQ